MLGALLALGLLPWSGSPARSQLPGLAFNTVQAIFFFAFAMTGLCAENPAVPGRRISLSCGAACLAALADQPFVLMGSGCCALLLTLSDRRGGARGMVRAFFFAAACGASVSGKGDGLMLIATLACLLSEARAAPEFTLAPLMDAGCGLLLLIRTQVVTAPLGQSGAAFVLLALGIGLAALRLWRALATPEFGQAVTGLAMLPALIGAMTLALFGLAHDSGSTLTAHAAQTALILDFVVLWPAAAAFLAASALVREGAGSDRLNAMGGMIGLAPRLAAMFAVTLAGLLLLPPTGGFVVLWMLVESALGLLPDGFTAALPSLAFLLALGLVVALVALVVLRLGMLVLMGGARRSRMAVCPDASWFALMPVALAAGCSFFLSLVPGLVRWLAAASVEGKEKPSIFALGAPDGLSFLLPSGFMTLLFVLIGAVRLVQVRHETRLAHTTAVRPSPFGSHEKEAASPWLGGLVVCSPVSPFGEPLLWPGADLVVSILRTVFRLERLPKWRKEGRWMPGSRHLWRRIRRIWGDGTQASGIVLALVAVVLCLAAWWS
ncbi:hypothetical protein AA0472_2901 [Acetobacter estunensis NRIC 0472]|uniref:NADH:quinone oxidoreductase/Mrp antiporter membrane subunit domain-containing protein n=1 Tax=Acetobacter estunensis TaxID=104097 RepID=A0A967B469_9PROT|nr:hypothetical protein [Acetobacter estunensis]NHO53435.1 hypothetical protein [Acetobacter estunensis]GBQ29075.1 hypothetical protein AA0472_2901 [Acetobacter estunensis NRIC 0472]